MVRNWTSLVLACVLAPVIAVSIGTVAYVGEFSANNEFEIGWFVAALFGAWFGGVIGIPTMLLIGLPLHFYFQSRGMKGLTPYAIGGAIAGLLAALFFMMWPPAESWSIFVSRFSGIILGAYFAKVLTFGALTGILAASLFWMLQRLGGPSLQPTETAS